MDDSLVDSNGFPRNDIDIYQIRIARNKIICNPMIRNQFKNFFFKFSVLSIIRSQ